MMDLVREALGNCVAIWLDLLQVKLGRLDAIIADVTSTVLDHKAHDPKPEVRLAGSAIAQRRDDRHTVPQSKHSLLGLLIDRLWFRAPDCCYIAYEMGR
jgi:hypothetical protein